MRCHTNFVSSLPRYRASAACLAVGACIVLAATALGQQPGTSPPGAPKAAAQAKPGKQPKKYAPAHTSASVPASTEKAIRSALQAKQDFSFKEMPLTDVVAFLKDVTKLEIQIDHKAFEELGLGTDVPITFRAEGITTESALQLILRRLDLAWVVRDGVLLITTRDQAESMLETRVYAVYDLLTPTPSHRFDGMYVPGMREGGFPQVTPVPSTDRRESGTMGAMMGGMMGSMMGGMIEGRSAMPDQPQPLPPPSRSGPAAPRIHRHRGGDAALPPGSDLTLTFDSLIRVITACVAPTTWDEVGGPGSIVPTAGMLVISQTAEVHQEIEKLLEALRAASPGLQPVAIRAAWLLLDANQLDQLLSSKSGTERGIDCKALAEMATKTKGYMGAITCSNGQTVHIASGQSRSAVVGAIPVVGSGVGYQPIVSNPQSGAVLQVTPQLLPNAGAAVLDLQSVVTRLEKPTRPLRFLAGQSPGAGENEEGEPAETGGGALTLALDRVKVVVDQLATTLKVPLGQPTLVGGLTHESSTEEQPAAGAPQLYLFIEVGAQ